EDWLSVAERAALGLRRRRWGPNHICCGAAGGFFALANLYRLTGETTWLEGAVRARDAALDARGHGEYPMSLFRGDLGTVLLDVSEGDIYRCSLPGFCSS